MDRVLFVMLEGFECKSSFIGYLFFLEVLDLYMVINI